jgi:hypothetical protein
MLINKSARSEIAINTYSIYTLFFERSNKSFAATFAPLRPAVEIAMPPMQADIGLK